MPRTFPKSNLAQFNLKYLQVKPDLLFSSKTENTITITILNPFIFPPRMKPLRESTRKDTEEEIQMTNWYDLNWKSNLYFK